MRDRSKILEYLAAQRTELEQRFRSMPAEQLVQPCTDSEHDGGAPWAPQDHLSHLLRIEEAFLGMAKRTIAGDSAPIKFSGTSRPEILAGVHRDNESHIESQRGRTLEDLLVDLSTARVATLEFIGTITDDQLDLPIPGAPWSDGTIGGVLMANGGHELQHMSWVETALQP
jgi:DinB superfamily